MRYLLSADGSMTPAQNTADFVELTVWLTVISGVALLLLGLYGRQRWLQFWGGLTLVCCAVYFLRRPLGLMPA